MIRLLPLILLGLLLLAGGCSGNQDAKNLWKYTSKQYRSYLNTPATLDMDAKGDGEDYQIALAEMVYGVDRELNSLVRTIENTGRNIGPEWVMDTMRRHPWLSGVALVDASGTVISRFPDTSAKEFVVTPLLEADPKQNLIALRAYVQENPQGPEIYLANPIFLNGEMRGLVVASFDPKVLAMLSPTPGRFVMASPAGVLWAGEYSTTGSAVATEDWTKTLASEARGYVGSSDAEFYWVSRYIGNLPIVYAIPTSAKSAAASAIEATPESEKHRDAAPIELQKHLSPGEVGDVGTPNVRPTPSAISDVPNHSSEPLEQ